MTEKETACEKGYR